MSRHPWNCRGWRRDFYRRYGLREGGTFADQMIFTPGEKKRAECRPLRRQPLQRDPGDPFDWEEAEHGGE